MVKESEGVDSNGAAIDMLTECVELMLEPLINNTECVQELYKRVDIIESWMRNSIIKDLEADREMVDPNS